MSSLPIVLAQRSSLEFLDLHPYLLANHGSWHPTTAARETLPDFGVDKTTVDRLERLALPMPVEVLVPKSSGMRAPQARGIIPHAHRRDLLVQDLVRIDEDIYACLPELALTHTLAGLSAPRAATVIDQMVSSYRIVRREATPGYLQAFPDKRVHLVSDPESGEPVSLTMYGLAPLTTLTQLEAFARTRQYVRGIDCLRNALPLCAERLRSPLETQDHLLLFCPRRLGGANLPKPLVNETIELSSKARAIAGAARLTPDFRWPDQRVVVEVLGAADHEGSEARIADTSKRERTWRAMGHAVMTHTAREIGRPSAFTPLAKELADSLGARYRTDIEQFAVRQTWLRHEVAPPVAGRLDKSMRLWREMLPTNDPEGTLEGDEGWLASLEP